MYGVQATNMLIPLLTFPYLVRTIGIERFGLLNYVASVLQIAVAITAFGFNFTSTQEVTNNRTNPQELQRIYSVTTTLKLGLMFATCAATLAISQFVSTLRSELPLVLGWSLLVVGEALVPTWFFVGMQRVVILTQLNFVSRVVGAGMLFLLVRRPSDYAVAAAVQALPAVFAGVLSHWVVRSKFGISYRLLTARDHWALLRRSSAAFVTSLPANVYLRGQFIVLGSYATATELGQFSVAQRFVGMASTFVTPFGQTLFPHVCHTIEQGAAPTRRLRRTVVTVVAATTTLGATAMAAMAPFLVQVVTGTDSANTIFLLRIMCPLVPIISVGVMLHSFAMGYRRYTGVLVGYVIGALLFLAMALSLTPRGGSTGMAITMVTVEAFILVAISVAARIPGESKGQLCK